MNNENAKACGERLRKLRHMAGLSTEEFAERIGYTRQTISYWENATHNGITAKGMQKVLAVMSTCNIYCDPNWLMYGSGELPQWVNNTTQRKIADPPEVYSVYPHEKHASLQQEIALFKSRHAQAVVMQLNHIGMQPVYQPGDWIGGQIEWIDDKLLGKICLVMIGGHWEVRMLKAGDIAGTYNLCLLNYNLTNPIPFELKNITLQEAAVVIRLWRE